MNLQQRIDLFAGLGNYLKKNPSGWEEAKRKAAAANNWFTEAFIQIAADNIINRFLQKELLSEWVSRYPSIGSGPSRKIGLVMAGNIPLVGFHDLLAVIMCGHRLTAKLSSKDDVLKDGDIVNVDCSTILNGYFSDSSRMFCIGNVSPEKKKLVDVTKECVEIGVKEVVPWHFLGDMGEAVHKHALENGYTIVREIGGHGCGIEFHEEPYVSYVTKKGTEMLMVPGMVFTIEPMVNMGTDEIFVDEDNDWTVYTADRKPSAQWEVQVLVTETGCEILTY